MSQGDSSGLLTSAAGSSHLLTSVGDLFAVDSSPFAVDSSAVDLSGADPSGVDPSAVDPSAVDSSPLTGQFLLLFRRKNFLPPPAHGQQKPFYYLSVLYFDLSHY